MLHTLMGALHDDDDDDDDDDDVNLSRSSIFYVSLAQQAECEQVRSHVHTCHDFSDLTRVPKE